MKEEKIVVVILGGSTNATGQIRAAYAAGYDCYNLAEKNMHCYTTKSRKCHGFIAPHPTTEREKCLQFTIEFLKQFSIKPFLFFATDDWMYMVGENEEEFLKYAHIIQSPWKETIKLYNKKLLYSLAEEYGVPYPKTIEVDSLLKLNSILDEFVFPCIVKPQLTVDQNEVKSAHVKTYHRTQRFESKQKAMEWVESMTSAHVDFPVLVQEFIPGDATNLYTLTSYSDKEGNLIAGSIGHKLRQFPPEAGRITAGILEYDEKLKQTGELFLKTIKFNGVANTEFKYDSRDGKFKLMEINTRFGAWNYSTLYSGMNLMQIAINDYSGIKYTGPMFKTDHDGHIWYNFSQDFGTSVVLNRKAHFDGFALSPLQWKKSLGKHHFEAIYDPEDKKPFLYSLLYALKDFIK